MKICFKQFGFVKRNLRNFSTKTKNVEIFNFLNKNSSEISNLYTFITLMPRIYDSKLYHYILFNNDTTELQKLKDLNKKQSEDLKNFLINNDSISIYSKATLSLDFKELLIKNIIITLNFQQFRHLLTKLNEYNEERVNNLIRNLIEDNLTNTSREFNGILRSIRDEWRDCIQPDVFQSDGVTPLVSENKITSSLVSLKFNLIKNLI